MKNYSFIVVTLDRLSVVLMVLVTFCPIFVVFEDSGKIKKCKMAEPRWPPFGHRDVIPTPYEISGSCCD